MLRLVQPESRNSLRSPDQRRKVSFPKVADLPRFASRIAGPRFGQPSRQFSASSQKWPPITSLHLSPQPTIPTELGRNGRPTSRTYIRSTSFITRRHIGGG